MKRHGMRKLRQSERSDLSDKRMVETAVALMLQRGISGLRLTEVGLRAGYSRGLAAMRFGTMGGLLRRVAEHLRSMRRNYILHHQFHMYACST
jgi:AcrR family transcriptional regulator